MKAIFLILGIILTIIIVPAQAQITSEFGYQLHPEKLLENTEGTLQIFVTSNNMMVPKQIGNLKVISSDNSIIQILAVEESNDKFIKNVMIMAKKPGMTTIALAASGFSSKEISLQVFNSNSYPTQLLMKITPEVFPIDGPKYGYIALEIATTGGLPTFATEDMVIHLDTPNKDIIKLKNSEVIVSSGEYYAITAFEIIGYGDAIIFAETEGMKKISSIVNVLEASRPLKLQLYVFPEDFNSFTGSAGYAIVQLLDKEGEPILAGEDIHFKLGVENPDSSKNTSVDFEEVYFDKKQLVIEKGSYSTFTKFTPRPNIEDFTADDVQSFKMFISAENILTEGDSFTIAHDEIGALEGNGPSVTKVLPFLTTGKQEIIAVTYYETSIEVSRQTGKSSAGQVTPDREFVTAIVPVQAKDDHKVIFSSSELDTVNPIDPIMKKGENVVVVFGETGTIIPEDPVEFYITDNEGVKTVTSNPIGPLEKDITLIVEPLVPMILAENQFPVLAYLTEAEGGGEEADPRLGVMPFIKDAILTFSANEFVETETVTIKQNQPYALMNMISNEVGTSTLEYQMSGFDGNANIVSHTTDATEIFLAFQKTTLANSKTLATIQLLDSGGNPVYAKKDIEITLVSNNEQILKTTQDLTIKNGNYFTTFEFETINEGQIELAILSEDFALTKYNIDVIDIQPVLSLDLLGGLRWNERIEGKLSVTIPKITTALDGFNVEWKVDGAEVLKFDEVTNSKGIAIINVIANEKEQVTFSAIVTGNGLSPSSLSKTAQIVNIPTDAPVIEESTLPIDTNTMIFIIIPLAIGASLFYLKRIDKLEMITEKIPIGDKLNIGDRIEEIKERISDIRNR